MKNAKRVHKNELFMNDYKSTQGIHYYCLYYSKILLGLTPVNELMMFACLENIFFEHFIHSNK